MNPYSVFSSFFTSWESEMTPDIEKCPCCDRLPNISLRIVLSGWVEGCLYCSECDNHSSWSESLIIIADQWNSCINGGSL